MTSDWLPKQKKLNAQQRERLTAAILQKEDVNPPVPSILAKKCQELRAMVESGNEADAWNEYLHISQVAAGQAVDRIRANSSLKILQNSQQRESFKKDAMPLAEHEPAKMPDTTPSPKSRKYKLRMNHLDPVIDKAILLAGNMQVADVYLKLKELALAGESPFSGVIEGDRLSYTDDDNIEKSFSKAALRTRLGRRKKLF